LKRLIKVVSVRSMVAGGISACRKFGRNGEIL
jgi:hypothetical protein